jgi:hypothetical protein
MIRNKIERFILSKEHQKHPNLIFGIIISFVILLITFIFIYSN